jgi:hypothetical protein
MYATDKGMNEDALIRLDRITKRLEEVLGPLDKFPLKDMKRDHGRRYMKHMLGSKKANKQPLAPATCLKEGNIISAMITHALRESDLETKNPFKNLPWPKDQTSRLKWSH